MHCHGCLLCKSDATVYIKTTNSWYDPEGEKQAAVALINEGCDVIGQHCDTPNPQLRAGKNGVYGVGYNSDMSKDAPRQFLLPPYGTGAHIIHQPFRASLTGHGQARITSAV